MLEVSFGVVVDEGDVRCVVRSTGGTSGWMAVDDLDARCIVWDCVRR